MHQFKTCSALLRHLEGKLTDCEVAAAEGGIAWICLAALSTAELAQQRT
jgi:hypothetical protein